MWVRDPVGLMRVSSGSFSETNMTGYTDLSMGSVSPAEPITPLYPL